MEGRDIFLKCRDVSVGYPDPGHDEYFLVKSEARSSKLLQYLLGNKETDILCYGERKPSDSELEKDKERYTNIELSNQRENRINSIIND